MTVKLDRKLWLTADKSEVVEDGDPRAAFLLGSEGADVPDDEAARLGLVGVAPDPNDAGPEAKQADQADNKQAEPSANKARGSTKKG